MSRARPFARGSIDTQEDVFSVLHPSLIITFTTLPVCRAAPSHAGGTLAAIPHAAGIHPIISSSLSGMEQWVCAHN